MLGIEAAGVVARCPGDEFPLGQQVVTVMGGMSRVFDGGYAEYTCVPAAQLIAFQSDWNGRRSARAVHPDRGGTSSVGMATAVIAQPRGMTVLSTTRNPAKTAALTAIGVDHVLVDDGDVARQVRIIVPEGVDAAVELVGTPTLPDTLRSTRVHGV